ncbi:MAG: hypothetical protein ACLVJH_13955 [Faecalibacterium prausnitzii]
MFLRCESTEKSMVRAVYLSQTGQGYQAGLLYQAPQAAADAAEASAALQFVQAEGQTMEQALAGAEQALPQTASYRLCDYLLLPKAEEPLLTEYEQLVLRRGCGRTAARLLCAEGETGHLAAQAALPDALMAQIKAAAPTAPRLYEHTEPGLLPILRWSAEEVTIQEGGVLHTVAANIPLSPEQAEVYRLLAGQGGIRQLWLEGSASASGAAPFRSPCKRRRCLCGWTANVPPTAHCPCRRSGNNLRRSAPHFCKSCWQQGVDVLHLQAREALRSGSGASFDQQKTPARNGGQTCISCRIKRQ